MPKTKISEYSSTANSNTDISGINIDEGCAPSGINNAIRTLMAQLKDWQSGTSGDYTAIAAGGTNAGTAATARVNLLPSYTSNGTKVLAVNSGATDVEWVTAATGDVTLTGTQTLTNKTLTNPTVTNYVETPYSANSSTAITLALTNGTVQIITLTGNATITMPTATSGKSFIMFLKQDATGSRTVTWSTVKWPAGTAPTITSTASKQDIFSFFADGTNWYGATVSQNYTP
jgi:hypothetical protein